MEWRPIETAPLTGEAKLIGYRHAGRWVYRVAVPRVIGPDVEWLSVPGGWQTTPTHWQPLPEPPPLNRSQ